MTYRLENEVNALTIEYRATTDKATVVNLTNHGFFNLAGISNPTPTVNNNIVTINADFYTPIDEVSIQPEKSPKWKELLWTSALRIP